MIFRILPGIALLVALLPSARADDGTQAWNLHGQSTAVYQFHPAFTSPYAGPNSLEASNNGKETVDFTLYAGVRLWSGAAAYADPEIDQGFGLSNTLGVAGFPSGEDYKVGAHHPYFRLPRAFVRQVIDTSGGGRTASLDDEANQLAGPDPDENVTITVGKYSVPDIFDANTYAHDARNDFMNWSVIESGAFDYPADAWGYTYGAAAEWNRSSTTWRAGLFALSKVPNSKDIDGQFHQFGGIVEFEQRHQFFGLDGKARLLGFLNRGRMGRYEDAVALGRETDTLPDTSQVRRYASRPGTALDLEQDLGSGLGGFLRASMNVGSEEAYEFTEINRSLAAGVRIDGARWKRDGDLAGIAGVVNALSSDARAYFAAGGNGILIGDGRLPNYGREKIVEAYYDIAVALRFNVTLDVQEIVDPAYNRDRGPVTIFGLRLHGRI